MAELSNEQLLAAVESALADKERALASRIDELDRRINGRLRTLEDWRSWVQGHAAGVKQVRDGRAWIPAAVAGMSGALAASIVGSLLLIFK